MYVLCMEFETEVISSLFWELLRHNPGLDVQVLEVFGIMFDNSDTERFSRFWRLRAFRPKPYNYKLP